MANDNNKHEIDQVTGIETTGHEWDGLKELNNPAPRWWLWVFYATIVFAIGYWAVYPAWPTLTGFTGGSKNWSEYSQLKEHQGEITAMRAKYEARFTAADLKTIQNDPELYEYARAGGAIAFKNNCAACHGAGAQGGYGYPNLNDDDWLWGGTLDQIYTTIRYGVRSTSDQTRISQMPAFGRDDLLSREEIEAVAEYVQKMHLGDKAEKTATYEKGKEVYANNCASCHGETGDGNQDVGAPRLNDDIWLYGGDRASIINSIANPHAGVMPTWEGRLSDSTIKQLAIYVHSLGGGK
ncbi:MAG: cytochrome-c oxidase, cbb3-type subunit III [Alphaproteobacteria bacterium]|nr:cytochrome-c oxidase, cbb3-type subunit III [Alphaproteobacteria bacterium]MBV8549549.1 cytochrome-c oxidase, cbb3-type subunit III [Alphaproteobacteria bacterium]